MGVCCQCLGVGFSSNPFVPCHFGLPRPGSVAVLDDLRRWRCRLRRYVARVRLATILISKAPENIRGGKVKVCDLYRLVPLRLRVISVDWMAGAMKKSAGYYFSVPLKWNKTSAVAIRARHKTSSYLRLFLGVPPVHGIKYGHAGDVEEVGDCSHTAHPRRQSLIVRLNLGVAVSAG